MKASTGNGPSRRMRARKTASSACSLEDASAFDMTRQDRRFGRALVGPVRDQNAGDNHRQGVDDAGGEGTDGEQVPGVGLAEELAEGSGQPVASEKNAG